MGETKKALVKEEKIRLATAAIWKVTGMSTGILLATPRKKSSEVRNKHETKRGGTRFMKNLVVRLFFF